MVQEGKGIREPLSNTLLGKRYDINNLKQGDSSCAKYLF
jgi:hypothetical protein